MKIEYRVAEAYELEDGSVRYVIEWTHERRGVQRPTFVFPAGVSFEVAAQEMKDLIDEERSLNERPTPMKLKENFIGKKF